MRACIRACVLICGVTGCKWRAQALAAKAWVHAALACRQVCTPHQACASIWDHQHACLYSHCSCMPWLCAVCPGHLGHQWSMHCDWCTSHATNARFIQDFDDECLNMQKMHQTEMEIKNLVNMASGQTLNHRFFPWGSNYTKCSVGYEAECLIAFVTWTSGWWQGICLHFLVCKLMPFATIIAEHCYLPLLLSALVCKQAPAGQAQVRFESTFGASALHDAHVWCRWLRCSARRSAPPTRAPPAPLPVCPWRWSTSAGACFGRRYSLVVCHQQATRHRIARCVCWPRSCARVWRVVVLPDSELCPLMGWDGLSRVWCPGPA